MCCWDSAELVEQGRWWFTDSKGQYRYKHERDIRKDEFQIWLDYQRMRMSPPEENTWERFVEEWLKAEGMRNDYCESDFYDEPAVQ